MASALWEDLVARAESRIDRNDYMRYFPIICLPRPTPSEDPLADIETFDGPGPWDRTLLDVEVEGYMDAASSQGRRQRRKVVAFSSNDYLNLGSHPAIRKAAAKAALVYGMGPRAAPTTCGHTDYHRLLENTLAEMVKKEASVVTPTGFAANTAFLAALGNIVHLTAAGKRPSKHEKISIFSDALNHASIIDGLRLVERHQQADIFVYRHNDMSHLDQLLSNCTVERKVVYTDSLFSMEGDFAPMRELVELRKKHGFLLVIDEAHTILTCGKNGGGIGELYGVEDHVDICIGTLSKAVGCLGGYIACSKKWRKLIHFTGRPFIFTTAAPLPVIAACYAALAVAKKEVWRRQAMERNVQLFSALTKLPAPSPIISLVVGTERAALHASKHMLECGFHVTAIRPPAVSPNSCRLRVTLTAAHSPEEIRRLVVTLSQCIPAIKGAIHEIAGRL
ncbi:hypothetical protein Taro_025708 [Colocasia esculenta]|uniref:serine C-palmitoyltransferase n=1 Tax=Colocasia esculenta TaxID=4460 RepID=A0A843V9J6_COLES|nr:hypothetical protein [Colocasia esculenta]